MNGFRQDVANAMKGGNAGTVTSGDRLQTSAFKNLSEADVIAKIGGLFTADMKQSGILASVSLAQFILECGYGYPLY